MMMRWFAGLMVMGLVLVTAGVLVAADQVEAIVDPAETGPAYAVQGEYRGRLDSSEASGKWGAQIIALGDDRFRLVGYEGGLPGAGWQRGDRTELADGKRTGETARFYGDMWEAVVEGGTLTVFSTDGTVVGKLEKVHRKSPTLGAEPPAEAIVLFDGSSAENFAGGKVVMDDLLLAGCASKQKFKDHSLHLEFRTPFKPEARGQARGNSGVYVQSRYEIQVLDSFGLEGKSNECGGIYKVSQPRVNMCLPPLTWQTYDIDFTAARYDESGKKIQNARVTVKHNGVVIHEDLELPHDTPGRAAEGPEPAPVYLQGHGNPVVYRNIWAVKKD